MTPFRLPVVFLAVAAATLAGAAEPGAITVAAAANLRGALDEVIAGFKAKNVGADVKANYGASGTFFAQIQNGAPFDVFLSAEESMPQKLVASGKADGSSFTYAFGKLVLWVPKGSKLDIEKLGAKALLDPGVKHIAVGNPSVAPYGVAAESVLKATGVYEALKSKIVFGENIQQAAQFAATGNAEAAFLPLSLVVVPPLSIEGRHTLISSHDYEPIVQAGVVLKGSAQPAVAGAFVAYLLGPEGRTVLEKYGYGLPGLAKE